MTARLSHKDANFDAALKALLDSRNGEAADVAATAGLGAMSCVLSMSGCSYTLTDFPRVRKRTDRLRAKINETRTSAPAHAWRCQSA